MGAAMQKRASTTVCAHRAKKFKAAATAADTAAAAAAADAADATMETVWHDFNSEFVNSEAQNSEFVNSESQNSEFVIFNGEVFDRSFFNMCTNIYDSAVHHNFQVRIKAGGAPGASACNSVYHNPTLLSPGLWCIYASIPLLQSAGTNYNHVSFCRSVLLTAEGWEAYMREFNAFFEHDLVVNFRLVPWGPASFNLLVDPSCQLFLICAHLRRMIIRHGVASRDEDHASWAAFHCTMNL